MYMYNQGYHNYNYAAGLLGILALAVAVTALLVVLVLPKEKDGRLPSFFQLLYDLFTPKTLVIEKLMQILYVFLTCLAVLYGIVVFFSGFFSGFGNLVMGLLVLTVGPILLRVLYELALLLVMQVKTVREISQKLDNMGDAMKTSYHSAPVPSESAPPAKREAPPLVHCSACGTWYQAEQGNCPICGRQPDEKQ